MQKTNLGNFELTVVSDGSYYLDGGAMFGIVPKPLWSRQIAPDEDNRIQLGTNCVVVRTGEHTVLIETGIGNKLPEKLQRIYGNQPLLLDQFERAGIDPSEIDIVINTHLHFDHCGWNTHKRPDGAIVPTFPNARYYYQRQELERAHEQHERDRISYRTENYDPLVANGQAVILDGDAEIVPGISVQLYPGHTRGHQAVMIESEGKRACYIGDLIPTTAHLQPTWVMAYDLFPLETIANRHRFYRQAVPEQWLVIFTHDHKTPWAYVSRNEEGKYSAQAVEANVIAA